MAYIGLPMKIEPGNTAWVWLAGILENLLHPSTPPKAVSPLPLCHRSPRSSLAITGVIRRACAVPLPGLRGQAQRDPAFRATASQRRSVPWPTQSGIVVTLAPGLPKLDVITFVITITS